MKRWVVIAAFGAALALQPVSAAERAKGDCYTPSAIEAEQAIRFLTDVMIVSTTCQDTIYAEFRLRNRDPILAYPKAMMAHGHDAPGFDRLTTVIAIDAAQQRACTPTSVVCPLASALKHHKRSTY